ncbi:hypothetical protein MtrunA17_Chr1g0208901 [Medicago truncatula]|uniref:MATE efflux family protein n=1 Tax=Medicago truncatula TaxID=3880 RepID=A0A396K0H0_MEDTR|nr:hypothetical protein MtrunA17_Chr1g0208901 [Medicago truncatula]
MVFSKKDREGPGSKKELIYVGFLALPMTSVTLSQYFLQIISMMMVGHLGKLSLSSTAIACYLSLCCLWLQPFSLSSLLGQDPLISQEAGKYAMCMIPALFAYATLQARVRYFLMQSLIFPVVIGSSVTL